MNRLIVLGLILFSVMAHAGTTKRHVAQSVDPQFITAGDLIFGLTQDYDSGMDLITVTNSKEEKICSYLSNAGESERFLLNVPNHENPAPLPYVLPVKGAQNRFFVTEWSLQSSAAPVELKILDAAQKGDRCVFVKVNKDTDRFLGRDIVVSYKKDGSVKFIEVTAEDDDSTNYLGKPTECRFDSKKGLACKTGKTKPYQPDNL